MKIKDELDNIADFCSTRFFSDGVIYNNSNHLFNILLIAEDGNFI
jgi:hypothetical protein